MNRVVAEKTAEITIKVCKCSIEQLNYIRPIEFSTGF